MDKFEALLCNAVAQRLNVKKLSDKNISYTLKTYRSMNKSSFSQYKIEQVLAALSIVISKKINDMKNAYDINLHEYQTQHLIDDGEDVSYKLDNTAKPDNPNTTANPDNPNTTNKFSSTLSLTNLEPVAVTSFLGIETIDELKLLVNPESMYERYYVALDSDYRNTTQENPLNITQFTWAYSPTQNTRVGFCNSIGNIHNIVGMRIYQPRIPWSANLQFNRSFRISILIKEFSAQAFITNTGSRFHFILRPNFELYAGTIIPTDSIELSTEDYNDGIFSFDKPFTDMPSVTLVFGGPITTLSYAVPFNRFIIPIEFTCLKDLEPDY
jgi:hypothetical protein